MPKPREHKTVQARILEYAGAIGWTFVPRADAELRRGKVDVSEKAPPSLFFDKLLDAKVREFNPRYAETGGYCSHSSTIFTPTSTATGNSSSTCATAASSSTLMGIASET